MENPSQIEENFYFKENLNLEAALKKAEETIEKLIFENDLLKSKNESISKVNESLQRDIQRFESKGEAKEKEFKFNMEELNKVKVEIQKLIQRKTKNYYRH
jgi:FtsZ-binding cell division protein ZapB